MKSPPPPRRLLDLAVAVLEGVDLQDPAALLQERIEVPDADDQPLVLVGDALALEPTDLLLARLVLAVEEDLAVGRLVASLQHPVGGSRPVLGLLAKVLAPFGVSGVAEVARCGAVEVGLVVLGGDGLPLAERPAAVPTAVLQALRGHAPDLLGDDLPPLGATVDAQALDHGHALEGTDAVLVLRGPHHAETLSAARQVARAAGARALRIDGDTPGASVQLVLGGAWPVLTATVGPSGHTRVHPLPRWHGPTLVVAGVEGSVEGLHGSPLLTWHLPTAPDEDRVTLWTEALGSPEAARTLGLTHRHRAGRIHDLARLAAVAARVDGSDSPTAEHVRKVAREGTDALGRLAQLLPDPVPDEALVLADRVREDLEDFLARARRREHLIQGLGVASRTRYRTGLRALLAGPSGTGKTLAVGWLATRLSLPLYRVDLASVVSKYIGETEQNLAELLARAEAAEVLLFFDEADSLFGKRTEVRHSTDRFANSQTNYLLQRIESYDGIVVLASNSRSKFDSAFARRLDVVIEFPLPPPPQRRDLWRAHLGPSALPIVQLNLLATACDLPGGHVRNAVLSAAVRAAEAERDVNLEDVVAGLRMEYRKLGKALPHALARAAVEAE